jgi:hypothetical protein
MTKYRVFTNDVGPNQYSAYCEVKASSDDEALSKGMKACNYMQSGTKVLVLSNNRKDLWPHGKTGRVCEESLEYLVVIGTL